MIREKLKRYFITGLIVLLPLWFTLYIFWIFFSFVAKFFIPILRPLFNYLLGEEYIPFFPFLLKLSAFLIALLIIWLVGLLATNIFGRKIFQKLDQTFATIPLIRQVYSTFSKLTQIFFSGKTQFQRVVLVEFPRKGLYALGFITNEKNWQFVDQPGEAVLNVFIPTTPNPTSGFFLLIPEKEVIPLEMSVDDALKMVISGGIVSPENLPLKTKKESFDENST